MVKPLKLRLLTVPLLATTECTNKYVTNLILQTANIIIIIIIIMMVDDES